MDQKLPLEEFPAFHTCNYKIKEEVDDKEFEVEELHHSIDIKEESTALEPEQIKCECYLCGIQFHDKSQLIEHLETQCLEKPFSCEICALRYLTKQQLNRHTKTHIGWNSMIPMPESAQDLYRPSCGSPAVPKHDHADLPEPKLEFVSITSKSWSDSLSEPCSPSRSESPRRESSSFLQSCVQHAEGSMLVKSKRIRKPDFCFFCETDVFNFARHIKRIHISELEVTKIFALEINSNERKDLIATLRKRGNFKKRSQICRKPVRSSKLDRLAEKCVPCKHCLGFYSSKQLWRHIRKCKLNKGDSTTTFSHLTDAQNLLLEGMAVDQELADTVFPRMLADKISLVAKKDEVICMFGAHYLKRHREKHYIHVCSRKMRELSRLLIAMMDAEPSVKSMYDVLQPQNFDLIVQCTKEVAKLDSKTDNCRSSTYATNINNSLKKCCDIAILNVAKGESMEFSRPAEESETDFKKTRYLLHDSWCFEASPRTAVPTVTSIAWNKISIITLTNDVKIFKAYLEAESGNAYSELEQNEKNSKAFQTLMETVFCRLLLLNRGRISELESLPLQVYIETDSAQSDSVDATLTERILLKNFKRVLIRNSRGNEVPVLFSADLQHHTKKLIELRKHFVYSNNIFLFASLRRSISVVGSKVFNKYATSSGAEDPTALTSIRLRKCLATISQLLSMSGGEIEQLATSMGHTADVQPPDDVDRIAKITKLLLLRENGEAAQYEGKELDQIDINLEIVVDDLNCSDDDSGPSETAAKPNTTNIKNTKKQRRIIVPWTEDQKRKAIKFFARHIKSKQPPKRFEVEELKSQTGDVFDNKSWQQVKVFVQNQYTRK